MANNDLEEPFEELESIEEIIKDELQKAKETEPTKLSDEAARQSDAALTISKTIFTLIESEPLPYFFDNPKTAMLSRLIERARLDNGSAHMTFCYIETFLTDALAKQEEGSKSIPFIETAIETLNSIAVRYFEADLQDELKGVHIAEILQRSEATLDRADDFDQKYFKQAVQNIKNNVERRIELRKQEKLNRDQIYEPNAEREENFDFNKTERFDDRMKRQKDRGLTRESAYLFIDYLLEYAGNDTGRASIRQRAEVVEFLTGYSSTKLKEVPAWFKNGIAKIKENTEIEEKIFNELQTVRKQFELLGLQKIVEKIDHDLDEN